jgi:hypothetical protein
MRIKLAESKGKPARQATAGRRSGQATERIGATGPMYRGPGAAATLIPIWPYRLTVIFGQAINWNGAIDWLERFTAGKRRDAPNRGEHPGRLT